MLVHCCRKPSKSDIAANVAFEKYLDVVEPLATADEIELRKSVVSDMQKIVNKWINEVSVKQGFSGETLRSACGKIFTFGSFRLGLITPGSDIDALCVAPKHISREDFFGSLLPILESNSHVSELSGVPDAVVPIIKLKYKSTEVDLTFARLNLTVIDSKLENLDNDNLLKHLDEKTVRSINGTRVADALLSLVPNHETYRQVLRFVRHWAKKRGLYSNSIGFFGGITWAILCARVCQMYPTLTALGTCMKCFLLFSRWNWSNPVILCPITQSSEVGLMGFKIWNPKLNHSDRHHLMPIITPSFPCMNSTYNVTETTRRILVSEFARAFSILSTATAPAEFHEKLIQIVHPPPFLSLFRYFFAVDVLCVNENAFTKLKGFVESRIRILLKFLENTPGIANVRPWPESFTVPHDGEHHCVWLIGLSFPDQASTVIVDLRHTIAQFHEKLALWNEKDNFKDNDDYSVRLFHVGINDGLVKNIDSPELKNEAVYQFLKQQSSVPRTTNEWTTLEEPADKKTRIAVDVQQNTA